MAAGVRVPLSAYGENIYRDPGRPSPGSTIDGWMCSRDHKGNVLDEVGVAAVTGGVNDSRVTA